MSFAGGSAGHAEFKVTKTGAAKPHRGLGVEAQQISLGVQLLARRHSDSQLPGHPIIKLVGPHEASSA
jgi:hypothetical protein